MATIGECIQNEWRSMRARTRLQTSPARGRSAMNTVGNRHVGFRGGLHVLAAAIAVLAMLPLTTTGGAAQGATTITLTSYAADGTTPLPFVRFQVTDDASGTVYGPLETPPGSAQVVFTITLGDPNATFTI